MEEEGDTPFVVNDIASSDFKDNKCPMQQKIIIAASLAFIIIILLIIIIIILASKHSSNDKESEEPEIENDINDKIGEIVCYFDSDDSSDIQILSDKFLKKSNFDIYIGDTKIKYSKFHNFGSGEHKVRFVIFGDMNMDNMFYDLSSLIKVNMILKKMQRFYQL